MADARRLEYVPLSEIRRARRNPKLHDEGGIQASLSRFGIAELPLIDERTGLLVAGEGRVNQLVKLRDTDPTSPPGGIQVSPEGEWLVPVIRGWASADDQQAEGYLVASNRLSEKGGWDDTGLAELLQSLQDDLTGLGFDQHEFDQLLRETDVLANQATAFLTNLPDPGNPFPPAAPVPGETAPAPAATAAPVTSPFTLPGSTPPPPQPQPQAPPPAHSGALPLNTTSSVGATEPQWFQLTWTATHPQRETIHEAIRVARDAFRADTAVEALAAICADYLATTGAHQ